METLGNTQEKLQARVVVDTLADKVAEVEVLTLSKNLGKKIAYTLHHTGLQASRGGELNNWLKQSPR